MMKNYLLFIYVSAISIFPGFAQTITSQKGLTTVTFNVPEGKITIYLPDDIRSGDIISGTVSAEPGGKNAKQVQKKGDKLTRYFIDFNGQKIPVATAKKTVQYQIITTSASQLPLVLVNEMGNTAAVIDIPCTKNSQSISPAGADCKIPTHALTAAPLPIKGSFDGNSSNTNCTIGNQPATVLAESPRQSIIQFPENSMGNQNLQIREKGGQPCTQAVSGVQMELSTGKLNLVKGEKTYLKVRITGLQNLPDTARLDLFNVTPFVVTMQPADQMVITLVPDSMGTGIFERSFDIVSIKTGSFTVNVNLDLPEGKTPVFADVRKPAGGKRNEKVLTAGTRTALEIAMKKWADANTEGKNPIDFECSNCIQCIKSYTTESNAGDVGELGWGIITSFLSGGVKLAGGLLEKVKDIADKGGDIYKAIKDLIADGKIQVIGFAEKWCANNGNCQVTGIIVYDVATGCAEAEYRCRGNKLCCPFAETIYKMKYCFDKDGAVIAETISITITH